MEFKLVQSKTLRILMCAVFIITTVFSTGLVSAVTVPVLTGAAYNISTGALVLTGTGFASITGSLNDFDPTKFILTDGNSNVTILTTATKKVDRTSDTAATIMVGASDAGTLAKWVTSSPAANVIKLMPGWNGPASTANFTGVQFTIGNMPRVTGATYDYTTGKLTLTGQNLISIAGAKSDITPSCIMVSDDTLHMNALTATTGPKVNALKTQAVITLAAADKLVLESFINSNGTVNLDGDAYKLYLNAGWNGPSSLGNMAGVTVTVTNWAAPVATSLVTAPNTTVKTDVKGKSNKMGSLYLVNSANFTNGTTSQTDLDNMVTAQTALKAPVTSALVAKPVTIKTTNLLMTSSTGAYCFVSVDAAGAVSSKSATFLVTNGVAPALSASVAAGDLDNTVVITATAGDGDSLMYRILSTSASSAVSPHLLMSYVPGNTAAYTAGTGLYGVDRTKFIELFEVNGSNQIVKYKLLSGTASKVDLNPPAITSTTINAALNTITITFDETLVSSGSAATAFSKFTYSQDDGATYTTSLNSGNLGACTASTSATNIVSLVFTNPSTSARVMVKIAAGAFKDAAGNGTGDLIATASDKSDFLVGTPVSTGTTVGGKAAYNVHITGAKDIDGNVLSGSSIAYNTLTVTSNNGATVANTNGNVAFTVGEATIPLQIASTTAAQVVSIHIAGVSATDSSTTITLADNSDFTIGSVTPTSAVGEAEAVYSIQITGAKDAFGNYLSGATSYTVTSSQQGVVTSLSTGTPATFTNGAATLTATLNAMAGAQTLTVGITGVSNTKAQNVTFTDGASFTLGTPVSDQAVNGVGHLKSGTISYSIPITRAVDAINSPLTGAHNYQVVTSSGGVVASMQTGTLTFDSGASRNTVDFNIGSVGTGTHAVWIHIDGVATTSTATTVNIAQENAAITATLPATLICGSGNAFTYDLTINATDFAGIGLNGTKNLTLVDSGRGDISPALNSATFTNGTAHVNVTFSTPGSHTITISSTDTTATGSITRTVSADASASYTATASGAGSNVAVAGADNITINLSGLHYADGSTVAAQTVNVIVTSTGTGASVTYATVFDPNGDGQITFKATTSSAYLISFPADPSPTPANTITGSIYTGTITVNPPTTAFSVTTAAAAIVEVITLVNPAYDVYGVLLEGYHNVKVQNTGVNNEVCFNGNVLFHLGLPSSITPIWATITDGGADSAGNLTVTITGAVGGSQTTTSGSTINIP